MSELRALTGALRAFDQRLTSLEECMLILLRNSEQESEWRHEQRNRAHADTLREESASRTIKQLGEFQGSLWKYLAALDERLKALADTRHDDMKTLNKRVGALEADSEVTRT